MNPKDKRRAPRSRQDSVLEIYDSDGHFIMGTGRLVNFSKVGVCISSTKALRLGETLRARLRLLGEGTLEASARVVWVRKKPQAMLYGLAFESVQALRA
jgi:hypothetical protein